MRRLRHGNMKKISFLHKAGIISEYMIIFSVIATALISMNVYLKRSFQGRTKDLTDVIIYDKHLSQVSDLDSVVEKESQSDVVRSHDIGGETQTIVQQSVMINRTTRYFDPDKELEETLTPGEKAEKAVTEEVSYKQFQDPDQTL